MSLADTNEIVWTYLAADAGLQAILLSGGVTRIYCPRLPENVTLPAVGFFTRGGRSTPYIPGLVSPSLQFDCWADDPIEARQVYRALYDSLQGIQYEPVVIGVDTFYILSAEEEVQAQDLVDTDIQGWFRTLSFWSIMIRAE